VSLPAPNLDDRRFQDLVDDAKRLVQQNCPEWTDHNVSDPGVTLIETFAYMVDQLIYRLNRVPDRHYVKFLELLGVDLFPPTAASADVTFWLSAPQLETVLIPPGTEVATVRTETEEAVTFTTVSELGIVPCTVTQLGSSMPDDHVRLYPRTVVGDEPFYCFERQPRPGDSLLVGLDRPVGSCAVALRFEGILEGVGVNPDRPPIQWEASDGTAWLPCVVDHDDTGGLNRPGDIVLHVPREHTMSLKGGERAAWLRCRVVEAVQGQATYTASPEVRRLTAHTIGGTVEAIHAETVVEETSGRSEGVPGQRFTLKRRPVVSSKTEIIVESSSDSGWQEWTAVDHRFAKSGPTDSHFVLDSVAGEVRFGPAVRERDGRLRQYGAIPPKDAQLRVRSYRTGGGQRGNVARGAISVLKGSVPYIGRVENRKPATGGIDGETIENAKLRGPLVLHSRSMAVTAEDYELIAREAAPDAERVQCQLETEPNGGQFVSVLVVPSAPDDEQGRLQWNQLTPSDDLLSRISSHLEERRVIGTRVVVKSPVYQGIRISARVRARPRTDLKALEEAGILALNRYFHPLRGGPEGDGWPFGRPVHVGEVYAVLQGLAGVELVEDAILVAVEYDTGRQQQPESVQRLRLDPGALVFSGTHSIEVREG
jgi:predicted phage baseplate assembly protein